MTAPMEFMYATGPLAGSFGDILHDAPVPFEAPAPAPLPAAITVRCIDRDGHNLATPITVRPDQPLATEALRMVIRDHDHGTCSADRFGRVVFNRLRDLDEQDDLTGRDKCIVRHLQKLDRLAIAGFEHDGTITW